MQTNNTGTNSLTRPGRWTQTHGGNDSVTVSTLASSYDWFLTKYSSKTFKLLAGSSQFLPKSSQIHKQLYHQSNWQTDRYTNQQTNRGGKNITSEVELINSDCLILKVMQFCMSKKSVSDNSIKQALNTFPSKLVQPFLEQPASPVEQQNQPLLTVSNWCCN